MLGCCGAPADWAGRKELFGETLAALRQQWEGLGSPQVITACSSCYRMFKDYASEMPVESLWTVLDRVGLPASAAPEFGYGRHSRCLHHPARGLHPGLVFAICWTRLACRSPR